ncbi:branched-chain amino acid ABC transporter permease [Bradyrhizobium sp.]|uniref:branched-chain amino acid ABC transporter permease n=1 Tax=Bradyrhizobium sp. TaxID=376 RepID=UPI002734C40E|nr:branched-chain amino acid ABC transporter permease [Bradyrhizobium sp.]MDP3076422.1 branched-chain amino acid ABC transporter permease [Bradyrhizobium sp.]
MSELVAIIPMFSISLVLALSCYLVLKSGEISFGQQAFFGVGAYAGGILTAMFDWPLVAALAVSAVAAAAVAGVIGFSLSRISGFRFTLMTLVLGEFAKEVFVKIEWRREVNGQAAGPEGPLGFSGIEYYYSHGIQHLAQGLIAASVAAGCLVAVWVYGRTGPGRRLVAVASDATLAASVSIDPVRTRLQAFAMAGAVAGIGGGLFAHQATYIEAANFSLMVGVHAVAYTLLGGLANVLGPVAGTAFDVVFLEGLRVVGSYRMVVFGSLIVVMLILRPRGLLGTRTRTVP